MRTSIINLALLFSILCCFSCEKDEDLPPVQTINVEYLNSGVSVNLWAVYFATDSIGYAVGSNNTIIKTTDAGANWILLMEGAGGDVRLAAVFFMNKDTGVVRDGNGVHQFTLNGGQKWTPTIANTALQSNITFDLAFHSPLEGINFPGGALIGYRVGSQNGVENGYIEKTTNGGTNYAPTYIGVDYEQFGVHFSNVFVGCVVGNKTVATTNDGGVTWKLFRDQHGRTIDQVLYSVYCLSVDNLYAVGGNKILRLTH